MDTAVIQRFLRTLVLCSFVSVGLLVVGCDSGGSNGDYEWTGKWEVISASDINLEQAEFFYDITSEEVTIVYRSDSFGCETETEEITNIDGNTITTDTGDGEENQATVEVQDDGNLFIEGVGGNDGTATARPVDSVPSCN